MPEQPSQSGTETSSYPIHGFHEQGQLLVHLLQAVDLEKCYEVEQKKGSKVDTVAFPVEGACDDFIGANEVERNTPDDRCSAKAEAADHCKEGKKVIAPHLWHDCEDDPCVGYIESGSGNATDEVQKTDDMPFAGDDAGGNQEPTGNGSTKKNERCRKHGLTTQTLQHFSEKRQARERPDKGNTRQIENLGDTKFRKLVQILHGKNPQTADHDDEGQVEEQKRKIRARKCAHFRAPVLLLLLRESRLSVRVYPSATVRKTRTSTHTHAGWRLACSKNLMCGVA